MRAPFTAHVFGSLLSFGLDAQRAEQDDGVLECNRSARRCRKYAFYPKVYKVRSDAMHAGSVLIIN